MSEAFINMATTLVTAFNKPTSPPGLSSPISNKSTSSIQSEAGVSPGRLADLQGKFFTQIEQLHKSNRAILCAISSFLLCHIQCTVDKF